MDLNFTDIQWKMPRKQDAVQLASCSLGAISEQGRLRSMTIKSLIMNILVWAEEIQQETILSHQSGLPVGTRYRQATCLTQTTVLGIEGGQRRGSQPFASSRILEWKHFITGKCPESLPLPSDSLGRSGLSSTGEDGVGGV